MALSRGKAEWQVFCYWCHEPCDEGMSTIDKGDKELWGVTRCVCGPDCRERPEGAIVGRRPKPWKGRT